MTKTPSAFEPTKPLTTEERAARKAFRQVEAEKAMSEHEAAQKAFSANRERLRSERLAREAAAAPVAVTKAKPKMSAEHARAVEWDGKVLSGWITVDGKPLKVSVDRETIHQHAPGWNDALSWENERFGEEIFKRLAPYLIAKYQ